MYTCCPREERMFLERQRHIIEDRRHHLLHDDNNQKDQERRGNEGEGRGAASSFH